MTVRAIFNRVFWRILKKSTPPESFIVLFITTKVSTIILIEEEGCALAEPGGPLRLTFAFKRLENLSVFIHIISWAL